MQTLLNGLQNVVPEMYVPIEEFAIEKSSQTFGNTAFDNAYFSDQTKIIEYLINIGVIE